MFGFWCFLSRKGLLRNYNTHNRKSESIYTRNLVARIATEHVSSHEILLTDPLFWLPPGISGFAPQEASGEQEQASQPAFLFFPHCSQS